MKPSQNCPLAQVFLQMLELNDKDELTLLDCWQDEAAETAVTTLCHTVQKQNTTLSKTINSNVLS
jgi:hypothetical protein